MKRIPLAFLLAILAATSASASPAHGTTMVAVHRTPPSGDPTMGTPSNKHAKQQESDLMARRETAYRTWFYRRNGFYPSEPQFRDWYYRAYGVHPS